jgi:hypothetical protein
VSRAPSSFLVVQVRKSRPLEKWSPPKAGLRWIANRCSIERFQMRDPETLVPGSPKRSCSKTKVSAVTFPGKLITR